ncbi:large ribosomal subunit protein uL13m [Procambarus clarkii]|uniref:large ribosomal subunit protein uL13m n=1 Tax=Procambarus clarkii TaxID=6728 RepID=UPI001E678ED2|nr:39S ribosomal protein L13, mitochondrial-like [Procambarus clarkii]XP_045594428.1 39S ribosomal protein L13, mitochondrial-like [Procambarus clarkii]
MSITRRVQQWATFGRMWYLYDAKWQNPFDSANKIIHYLSGSNKPIYHPLSDCGDHVVVINSQEIALPGMEWEKRVYFHHTGYARGASWTLAWELHKRDPTMIVRKAVYNKLDKNLLRRGRMARLHIFPDDKIPDNILENVSAHLRQLRDVPTRLDHYPEDYVTNFPKVFDWPTEHVIQ